VALLPVRVPHSIPTSGVRNSHQVLRRPPSHARAPDSVRSSPEVLYCLPFPGPRGKLLQFQSFDEAYVERLRAGDFRTQEHFVAYFSELIQIKLRARLRSREAIQDVRQETFARVLTSLRDGKILHPERLGSFVNSTCGNVLLEHYRATPRASSFEDEKKKDFPDESADLFGALWAKELGEKVRRVLEELSERDQRLLREVFLEERNKDEVCRDFGVDRDYLRVLLHRAKQSFKSLYFSHMDGDPPSEARAQLL
jgi:RNA polymerase sigma-70 factor (ECF subfamily)